MKIPHSIPTAAIRAALIFCGPKDPRLALTGLHIAPARGKLVAADGTRLISIDVGAANGPAFTISAEQAKRALRTAGRKTPTLDVTFDSDTGAVAISAPGSSWADTAQALDAVYPDYERILRGAITEGAADPSITFDWSLIADCQKAWAILSGSKDARVAPPACTASSARVVAVADGRPATGIDMVVAPTRLRAR